MAKVRDRNGQHKTQRENSAAPGSLIAPKSAEKNSVPRPATPNWIRYPAKARVQLWEAVALTCDLAPEEVGTLLEQVMAGVLAVPDDLRGFFDRLHGAIAASDRAFPISGGTYFDLGMTWTGVVPLDLFARWVAKAGWNVPESFQLLSEPEVEHERVTESAGDAKVLGTRERNTLYQIILGLAHAREYALESTWNAAECMAKDVEGAGYRVDVKTIDNHLKAAIKSLGRGRAEKPT